MGGEPKKNLLSYAGIPLVAPPTEMRNSLTHKGGAGGRVDAPKSAISKASLVWRKGGKGGGAAGEIGTAP